MINPNPPLKQKKVVIAGAYGCGNIGDDAILAGLLRLFDPRLWEVTVLAAGIPNILAFNHVRIVRQRLNLGLSWSVFRAFHISGILSVIRQADILVIGGGALLHDIRFYNLPYFFTLHSWAKFWKTRVVYLDIGAGPIRTTFGKWLCRCFLSRADYISVRDKNGKEELIRAGVKRDVFVTADPAFLLTPADVPDNIQEIAINESLPDTYIAVTVCGWFKSEDFWNQSDIDLSRPIQRTAEILDWIVEKTGKPLVFIPTVVPYDRELAKQIREKMIYHDHLQWLQKDYPVEILLGLFGKAEWLFGMRLHSMILSTIMGVPFFAVVYDQKVTHFMEAQNNPHRILLNEIYREIIFKKLESFIKAAPKIADRLNTCSAQFRQGLRNRDQQIRTFLSIQSSEKGVYES